MRLVSWNVNGLRAAIRKGFWSWLKKTLPDIVCLQEAKIDPDQLLAEISKQDFFELENLTETPSHTPSLFDAGHDATTGKSPRHKYHYQLHDAAKPGYAGVCTLSRHRPRAITTGLHDARYDAEGRTLVFEYDDFTLLNCYFPNAQRELTRLDIKLAYNEKLLEKIAELRRQKRAVIVCGDFNVAHTEIDIKNAASNRGNSGFTDAERAWFSRLVASGFVDTFRHLNPAARERYTWWSNRPGVRERNIGWRIDYFVVNQEFLPRVKTAVIHEDIFGSDHCPVGMEILTPTAPKTDKLA